MIDYNQPVEITWNKRTKRWYEDKGYEFTGFDTSLVVKIEDLMPNSTNKIKVICDVCGKEIYKVFREIRASHVNNDMDVCNKCKGIKTHQTVRDDNSKNTYKRLQMKCNEKGYKLITGYSNNLTLSSRIEYECPIHGITSIDANNFLNGNKGCNKCGNIIIGNKRRLSSEEVSKEISLYNGNICLNPEEYIGTTEKNLRIRCGECGEEYFVSLVVYKASKSKRCPKCTARESGGERFVKQTLEANNIKFIKEKRFEDCKDKNTLPFDFYLPEYNVCIEYDGEQHYKPKYGQEQFKSTQYHDRIKDEYCKTHNIQLYRIPATETSKLYDVIDEILAMNK